MNTLTTEQIDEQVTEMSAVDGITAKKQAYVNDLRNMVEFLGSHLELVTPCLDVTIHVFPGKDELASMAKILGNCEKNAENGYFRLIKRFGVHQITVLFNREDVCEKVSTGTKKIKVSVPENPDVKMIEVEKEIETFEWVCPKTILGKGK